MGTMNGDVVALDVVPLDVIAGITEVVISGITAGVETDAGGVGSGADAEDAGWLVHPAEKITAIQKKTRIIPE